MEQTITQPKQRSTTAQTIILVVGLVLLGFSLMFYIANNQECALRLFEKLFGRWPRVLFFALEKIESMLAGLSALQDIRQFLAVIFWMTSSWAFNVLWYYVLLGAFLPQRELVWAVFLVGVSSLGVAVPSSPAYIGVLHASIVAALAAFGVDESAALGYAVVAHALYFIITVGIGAYALGRDGQSLGRLYWRIRNRPA